MLSRILGGLLFATLALHSMAATRPVSVLWQGRPATGEITVLRGTLVSSETAGTRLDLFVEPAEGATLPTLVTIADARRPFTFRLADVDAAFPIYLPADGIVITSGDDKRSFEVIATSIRATGARTKLQRIADEPEENFAHAASRVRDNRVQTWLGLSRDDRLFRVDSHLDWIEPRQAGRELRLPETDNEQVTYDCAFGRGWGVRDTLTRRLDEGVLPILHATVDDDEIRYEITFFTTLERQPLTAANVRGTPYLLADTHGHGAMFTPTQKAEMEKLKQTDEIRDEETVLRGRVTATNRGRASAYAFLRGPTPTAKKPPAWTFDAAAGLGVFKSGRAYLAATLDGRPAVSSEVSPLLHPGQTAVFEFALPHRPVSRDRALALAAQPFARLESEVRDYWRAKLAVGAQWRLPEPHLDERVKAGLLHLDLIAYGREPDGPLLPAVGVYTAIGSESAPIIQFMDSMGRHETAARMIDYFLAKQHDDGFMQNFNGYMLETGAILWTMGEHFRYTRDAAWLRRVHPRVTLACGFLQAWRRRNLQPELKGDGFGLLDGKSADPEDPYRSFMLNGYAYLGLARAGEMLADVAPEEAATWRSEAEALKADIRASLEGAFARGPVVPLGDGTWSRAAAPWTMYHGPVMLHADGGAWYTHWSITSRDSLLGPLYLAFQEIIDPREPMADELLQVHSALATQENTAFTQPYYSRHPWLHLERGETKAFLKAWYNTLASMSDRETYTFTEHLYPVSAHKTHEEAWFLMEARWMLYSESGRTLSLLRGVPSAYLEAGREIVVRDAASYFGPLSFSVSAPGPRTLTARITCAGPRHPDTVLIRLPHPSGKPAVSVRGGHYDAATETLRLDSFSGEAEVTLEFPAPN